MAWEQERAFNLSKMGTRVNYCLQNVRLAYDIPPKYADAKAAMIANRNAGTLHDISTVPTNCAVPVFTDTSSPYEHIMVCDHGTYYSDGKRLSSVNGLKFFGWGETLNGVRIVKWVEDPKPAPAPAKKSNEEIADEVIAGKWGNGQERKDRLAAAGYDWGAVQAIVDQKLKGNSGDSGALKVGDAVTLTNWVDVNGTRLRQTRDRYYISQIIGDSAVLRADNANSGAVYARVSLSNLRRV